MWERTALARAVAVRLVAHRAEHGLSQTALARELGMKQPAVARLEIGETNPSIETLRRLSSRLGLEFLLHIAPNGQRNLLGTAAEQGSVVESIEGDGDSVLVAVR